VIWNILEKRIDTATTIDISLGDARKARNYNPVYYREDFVASALGAVVKQFYNTDMPIILASVEDYVYGDKAATLEDFQNADKDPMKLAETHGVICSSLARMGIPIIKPSISLIKYFVTGYGHADKRRVIKHVHQIYGCSLPDEHQYDALAAVHVARYFVAFCRNPGKCNFKHHELKAMNRLMTDRRFEGVGAEVKERYRNCLLQLQQGTKVS
jgi:Holliday junction resolvasome RuvABC endonuclease subunit